MVSSFHAIGIPPVRLNAAKDGTLKVPDSIRNTWAASREYDARLKAWLDGNSEIMKTVVKQEHVQTESVPRPSPKKKQKNGTAR